MLSMRQQLLSKKAFFLAADGFYPLHPCVNKLADSLEGDEKTGARILLHAP